ncbi:hypothetical protein ACFWFI_10570 [Streptomyces sp. NPDC060209]|uniref:hypothetical protein n=1 Tax=Streptomyces sp. NPDC060209 TaxID=3347073 RepID=UPI003664D862
MSHDYAAIMTSVNAGVLLVATIQYGAVLRKYIDQLMADTQERYGRIGQMIEARRNGSEPSTADLIAAKPPAEPQIFPWRHRMLPRRYWPYTLATLAYFVLCWMLLSSMMRIFRWAGTADAGPEPGLARWSFFVTGGSLAALLFEAVFLVAASGFRRGGIEHRRFEASYSTQEISEMDDLIEAAAPTPSIDAPAAQP